MIRPGDRVVLTRPITTRGGFLSPARTVVAAGAVGVVRRAPGLLSKPLVSFPQGGALVDHEVAESDLIQEYRNLVVTG